MRITRDDIILHIDGNVFNNAPENLHVIKRWTMSGPIKKEEANANRKEEESNPRRAARTTEAAEAGSASSGTRTKASRPRARKSPSVEPPDYVEPLLAYRNWNLHLFLDSKQRLEYLLRSTSLGHRAVTCWLPRQAAKALCYCGRFESKEPFSTVVTHKCGIYAYSSLHTALSIWYLHRRIPAMELAGYRYLTKRKYIGSFQIYGGVWMWGTVIEHQTGYRAEYAYPAYFWKLQGERNYDATLKTLAKQWGVDLVAPPKGVQQDL